MKTSLAGLNNNIQSSYANNGKTTTFGRAFQKSINSQNVLGPQLTQWLDVFQTYALYPLDAYYNPVTGHLFILASTATTLTSINVWVMMFNFSASTSWIPSYVGKVNMNFGNSAANTPTIKHFAVYENSGNITPIIGITGSVVIDGGTYICYNLTSASFTVGGNTAFPASSASQAGAMYFLQDPAALGASHVATTCWGGFLPQFSSSGSVNTKVWHANGTLALPQMYSWDLSVAPTVAGTLTNGISAQTTAYASTSPSAYFTTGTTNPGFVTGDQVVLLAGTGGVPTGFTAWASGTLQTTSNVYFVRDVQTVSGSYYFNLSATSGGAAIVPTSTSASFTIMRAFGISSSMFSLKTGVLTAISGGAIVNNTMNYCKPISSPANTTLQGLDCFAFQTSTSLYMGKLSDLTSGATTWPSLNTAGIANTGTGSDVTAITTTQGEYSGQGNAGELDNFVMVTNGSTFVVKPYKVAGSALTAVFGGTTDTYYAGQNPLTIQIGVSAVTQIHTMGGWLFVCSTTAGQAGVVIADMGSDATFGYSGIVSPVLQIQSGTIFKYLTTIEQLFNYTDSMNFWVRSASTSTDPSFSSVTLPVGAPTSAGVISNGWTSLGEAIDLSSVAVGPYFQFCVTYDILDLDANTPAQIYDLVYAYLPPAEQSDNWAMDNDNTTQGSNSPSYVSWRLMTAYASAVPTLYARVYDTSGNLIFSANTSANPTSFQYSTNDGLSWTALGTIPNTPDTRVRVLVNPTPVVTVAQPSLRES